MSPSGSGKNISLNIADLANEMLTGLDSWFNWVLASATEAGKVATRLHRVISPRPKVYPDAPEDVHTTLSYLLRRPQTCVSRWGRQTFSSASEVP